MDKAWAVERDDEIRGVFACEQLQVRPPLERVPAAMQGTALGDIYGRMVRFNEGARRRELREIVERQLSRWSLDEVAALTREAAASVSQGDIAGYVVARMIGIRDPQGALGWIRDFAAAIAAGADDETIARGVPAAEALLKLLPPAGPDEQANLLGFLFQSYAATAQWIEKMRQGRSDPPVLTTRRFAKADVELCGKRLRDGDVVSVKLEPEELRFGDGRHACPGRRIAETIARIAAQVLPEG